MAQKAIGMGLEPSVVEKTILEKIIGTGTGYSSLEALMEDCINNMQDCDASQTEEQGTVHLVCKNKYYS